MKRTFYSILTFCIIFLIAIGIANSAATKRVIVEEFTGAWCGYCVDGAVVLDQIVQANPGKVFGIKVHNGDGMVIADGTTIEQTFGVASWPTGDVDRTPFQGSLLLNRGSWASAVSAELNTPGIADIKLQWTYDQATNKILANISAKFDQGVSDEIRFNVYIIEDKVTGTGSGYNQSNYYNTTAGHPMYGKGNPVIGYEHNETLRACLGGPFGQPNSIIGPVSTGSTAKYSFEIQKSSTWNLANIRLIGVVQYFSSSNRKFMNAVEGEKVNSSTVISSTGEELFVKPIGETPELSINIKNNGTSAKEYTLSLTKAPGTTWTASIEPNEFVVSIPPAQTYNVKLKLNVNASGSGLVNLNIEEGGGMSFSRSLRGYSQELSMIHVNADPAGDASGLGTLLKSFPEYTLFQSVPSGDFTQIYSKFTDIKLVYYNTGDGGVLSATENSVLQSLISKKVSLIFSGPLMFKVFNDNLPTISGQLGFAWNGMSFQGQTTGIVNFAGIAGDAISNGFSSTQQLYYLLHKARVTDPSICSKIVTLTGNTDSVFAVKTQLQNSKAVVFGFHPMGIQNATQRNNLVYNALKWVFASTPAEAPEISTPGGISFDEVAIDRTAEKKLTITNSGKKDLVISNIEIKNNTDNAYSILDYGKSTIAPGANTDVTIRFAPSAVKFYSSATIEVSSNDPNKAKAVVTLSGKGGKAGDVKDLANVNLTVSPNPVSNSGKVSFEIPEISKSNILSIVDINGNTVLELGQNFEPGVNNITFESTGLNPGVYFIVLKVNEDKLNVKFTVNK